jgi:predicted HAD superfamily Cof-like phosphohydrolase
MDIEDALFQFHDAYGVPVLDKPTIPDADRQTLRVKLIDEEYEELMTELHRPDQQIEKIAQEAVDLVYVVVGMCLEYGIPFNAVFEEVQRANMSKLGEDGRPIRREDGKILKGPNFVPADVQRIIQEWSND